MFSRKNLRSLIRIIFFVNVSAKNICLFHFYNVLCDLSFLLVQQPLDPSGLQTEASCHAETVVEVYHFMRVRPCQAMRYFNVKYMLIDRSIEFAILVEIFLKNILH